MDAPGSGPFRRPHRGRAGRAMASDRWCALHPVQSRPGAGHPRPAPRPTRRPPRPTLIGPARPGLEPRIDHDLPSWLDAMDTANPSGRVGLPTTDCIKDGFRYDDGSSPPRPAPREPWRPVRGTEAAREWKRLGENQGRDRRGRQLRQRPRAGSRVLPGAERRRRGGAHARGDRGPEAVRRRGGGRVRRRSPQGRADP